MALAELPLALGMGLDRSAGLGTVSPASAEDTRNFYVRDSRLYIRPGMGGTGQPALAAGTDLVLIIPSKSTGDELFVTYTRSTRVLGVYQLNSAAAAMQSVGTWATLASGSPFPTVVGAEANGKILLAHDEGTIGYRAKTYVWTPNVTPSTVGTLAALQADLDGTGTPHDVYFRGVYAYLVYMWGWGFGSYTDPDRGDMVRYSKATDPVTWTGENALFCGVKKDPIRAVSQSDGILGVMKFGESYKIEGTDPDTFGIFPLDMQYGCVSARGAVQVGQVTWVWANDGPRVVTSTGLQPIAQALNLLWPAPADFPALGDPRYCFGIYDPMRHTLEWYWPDPVTSQGGQTPGFLLSLWKTQNLQSLQNQQIPQWFYVVRAVPLMCAGYSLVLQQAPPPVVSGYVSGVTASDA